MDIIAVVKLSLDTKFVSDELVESDKLTWDDLQVLRAKKIVEETKGALIQVKSGLYQNLMHGVVVEIQEVKEHGKILYHP